MPADDLYWNPMDLDSDESIPYPKQYIDPWDLENYDYIRQHLDSVDLNSDPSSLGEIQDSTSTFYYVKSKTPHDNYYSKRLHPDGNSYYSSTNSKLGYDTLPVSEHGASNYAAIDELMIQNEAAMMAPAKVRNEYGYGTARSKYEVDYEADAENSFEQTVQETLPKVHKPKTAQKSRRSTLKNLDAMPLSPRIRRHSFSVAEYEYDPYGPVEAVPPHAAYYPTEDLYIRSDHYDSTTTAHSPIYDDIHSHRPRHFKLSNYGHLQIDYSCNWNNLNKYICN